MLRPNRRLLLDTVSIGRLASFDTVVDNFSIAIGRKAGYEGIGDYAIAIGELAGETTQGMHAIAIGSKAGNVNQGQNSIAIGSKAGLKDQPENSIIISTNDTEIVAKKKGLYIDPIRKFDDRENRPATVKEGNVLSYNYKNGTPEETKEVVTGFPRLPGYPTDAEVALAITLTAEDAGTMYFDTTKKKIKVYDGAKWTALADEEDIKKAMAAAAAAAAAAAVSAKAASAASKGGEVYVPGTDADPFVTGPGIGNGKVLITDPDGTVREAVDGRDFYWNRDAQPIFFKDLEVVSVTRTGGNSENYPDGGLPPNRAGYVSTNYSNGHSMLEPIPLEEWNPPLAAMNKLPPDQARSIIDEYATSRGITFMTQGDYDQLGSYYSDDYRSFLESKGLG